MAKTVAELREEVITLEEQIHALRAQQSGLQDQISEAVVKENREAKIAALIAEFGADAVAEVAAKSIESGEAFVAGQV